MNEPIRIAISGAASPLSYALLFRVAAGSMFGADHPIALSLLETPAAMPNLEAIMMELDDCDFPLLRSVRASTSAVEAFADADWVILLSGVPSLKGMTRAEQLLANGPIMLKQGRAVNESAKAARVLVVANPCNSNCLIAQTTAHDVAPERWFALTRHDQNRGKAMLAHKAGVPVEQVSRVTAWGNHGPSVFIDFHNAFIGDRPAHEVVRDDEWVRNVFEPGVAGRGLFLDAARGASPAASTAQAILGAVRSLVLPSPVNFRFSSGVVSDGSYGVPRGLVFSFPLRSEDGRSWSIVQDMYLDDHAMNRIAANVVELEQEAVIVGDLLGHPSS
jgi:malate dehydrogenase